MTSDHSLSHQPEPDTERTCPILPQPPCDDWLTDYWMTPAPRHKILLLRAAASTSLLGTLSVCRPIAHPESRFLSVAPCPALSLMFYQCQFCSLVTGKSLSARFAIIKSRVNICGPAGGGGQWTNRTFIIPNNVLVVVD